MPDQEIKYLGPLEPQKPTPAKPGIQYLGPLQSNTRPAYAPVDISPFPFDDHLNKSLENHSPDQRIDTKNKTVGVFGKIAQPWLAQGYTALSALNRGSAWFFDSLDAVDRWMNARAGTPRTGTRLFDSLAKIADDNADHWKERAEKVGVGFIDEWVGEGVGGIVPGIVQFAVDLGSGLTIPAIRGAQRATDTGANPFVGGLVEAAKTGTLGTVLRMAAPFSRYIQATVMGTTFGAQAAVEAPEGERAKAFVKGAATGAAFGAISPGGYTLKDIYPEIGTGARAQRAEIAAAELKAEEKPPTASESGTPEPKSLGAAAPGSMSPIPNDPDIGQLTQALRDMPKEADLKTRIRVAESEALEHTGILDKARTAWAKIKATGQALQDWYYKPPSDTTFDVMFGKYLGDREISGMKTEEFAKTIQDTIPRDRQEAITKWIRTGGDLAELERRANESTDPKAAKKYRDAMTLTTEETALAENVRQYYDVMLERATEAGILEHGIGDYVNRVYKVRPGEEPPNSGKKLIEQAASGMLSKNPAFTRKRFYEHDWDAEQEGAVLEDRIGFLIAVYQKSFDEAIAARQFMRDLAGGTASDGRPLVAMRGSGVELPKGTEPPEAYLIKPHAAPKPKEGAEGEPEITFGDYRNIDYPALRAHKWVAKDSEGKPIFLDADMVVHPEAYGKLKASLERSAVQASKVGSIALKGSGLIKGTILGFFSSFHQAHLAQHALTHGISPFFPDAIDIENPVHKELIEHGLKLYDGNALQEFMEGAQGPGLIKYIPKVGDWAQSYTDYLFKAPTGYIPRLKMKLAAELFERNLEHYPDLSRDQAAFLSASQANAAMGGVNYKALGRSQTTQDLFRLAALAPDFLEARARFFGQSFKPYGREQFTAMVVRGAIGMYVAAKVIEGLAVAVDPDENKMHFGRPFSVTMWGKEYTLRSVQGDVWHAIHDPRSFIYNRLNPAFVRPLIEGLTGRDQFGRIRDWPQTLKDWAVGSLPIAGQGHFTKRDYSLWQSILQSMGISSWQYRTDAERLAREINMQKSSTGDIPVETEDRRGKRSQLTSDFKKTKDFTKIRESISQGEITAADAQKIIKNALTGDLERGIASFTVPEALRIWKVAENEEKATIQPILIKKWFNWDATAEERDAFAGQMEDVLKWQAKK